MEEWRSFLYPLGFLSSLFFGLRGLSQWIESEVKKRSIVSKSFWILSLLGNVALSVHSFIQIQFHVFVIQVGSAYISWRNLNLLKPKDQQISTKFSQLFLSIITFVSVLCFIFFFPSPFDWFRSPNAPWRHPYETDVSWNWHLFGCLGYGLFSLRTWIQWRQAENQQQSYIGPSFWWLSLCGSLVSCLYFVKTLDEVNLIGPAVGLIPYIRNLMLLRKTRVPAS